MNQEDEEGTCILLLVLYYVSEFEGWESEWEKEKKNWEKESGEEGKKEGKNEQDADWKRHDGIPVGGGEF